MFLFSHSAISWHCDLNQCHSSQTLEQMGSYLQMLKQTVLPEEGEPCLKTLW